MLKMIFGVLFCVVCVLLILIVLLQRGRGGGLSGAFGGAGGHSAFGSKTGDVFTWITVGFTALYLLLSVTLVFVYKPEKIELLSADEPKIKATPTPTLAPAQPAEKE